MDIENGSKKNIMTPKERQKEAMSKYLEELKTHRTKTIAVAPQTELEKSPYKICEKEKCKKKGKNRNKETYKKKTKIINTSAKRQKYKRPKLQTDKL